MNNHFPQIRTIIVDDEKPARELIKNHISEHCPELEIVALCNSVTSAYRAILKHQPQLVFLDIEMPGTNGFELLNRTKKYDFHVIFITAYSDYAANAFRVSAVDFLTKPVKIKELNEAVNKVKQQIALKATSNLSKLLDKIDSNDLTISRFIIPNSHGFSAIDPSDIILCEANGYCTTFYILNKLKITSSRHLRYYSELLPRGNFIRVHNSYIININHVTSYSSQGEIHLSEGNTCPLSNSHKKDFLNIFRKDICISR